MKRKATFKTLLVCKDGSATIISQDSEPRRRNVITGLIKVLKNSPYPMNCWNAKSLGCNILVREK